MSWQAMLLKTIFRTLVFFIPLAGELDIPRERAILERYTKVFRPLGKVEVTRLDADGIPAAWIVPHRDGGEAYHPVPARRRL